MIRHFAPVALAAALTSPGLLFAQPNQSRTFAFLVACGNYDKTQLKPVPFTVSEMKLFRDVLVDSGVPVANITFLHDKADEPRRYLPIRANVLEQFHLLLERLRPEDAVIVALSGHGVQFKGDSFGYFCPLDAKVGPDTKNSLLPMEGKDGVLKLLEKSPASRKLLIVNACRNNPTSSLNLAAEKVDLRDEYNEEAPKGSVMLLACKQKQFSWFYPETEKRVERRNRSLFMYHLTEAWRGSYANGKKVTVDHVIAEVSDRVEADAVADFNRNQIPIVKRKFEGQWDLSSAASYDLTGGHRFCHFGPDNSIWALLTDHDQDAKRYHAWVLDVKAGRKICGPLTHQGLVSHAAFSLDGTWVVTASYDKTAVVWNARTGQKVAGPLIHEGEISHAAFSPDGTRVVTSSSDKTTVVWDARTGQRIAGTPPQQALSMWYAAFSPDNAKVVALGASKTASIWDARTSQKIVGLLAHEAPPRHAVFSRDGTRVVTAGMDCSAIIWDAQTGQKIAGPLNHEGVVRNAAFSPDSTCLVTASTDKTASIWDSRTGRKVAGPLIHQDYLCHATFSLDGLRVATGSEDRTAVIWDARTGQKIVGPLTHQNGVWHTAFSPDGTQLVTATYCEAVVWDARTGEKLGSATVPK